MIGSYKETPGLGGRVFSLLDAVFPGIAKHAEETGKLGARWEDVSVPFVGTVPEDGGAEARIVSHAGLIELPLVVMGRGITAATIHAVATHPDHRRGGRCRRVMEEALEYCDSRCETQLLTTEHPEYFEPFGFRHVQEHRFHVATAGRGGGGGFRLLDMRDHVDRLRLLGLLEEREPVSGVVGVIREKAVFCFNEAWRPLYYSPDLNAVLCLEIEGRTLRLYDVVAPKMPSLADILDRLPHQTDEVLIHFSPDHLGVEARAERHLLDHDGPSYLMVRGPFAAEGESFTLPRSGRT